MGRSQGYVTKTHFLNQTNLGSLLEPANPSEADFTATKGAPVVIFCGAVLLFLTGWNPPISDQPCPQLTISSTACVDLPSCCSSCPGCTTKHSLRHGSTPHPSPFCLSAVVVTIGPSCQDVDTLCLLLQAGATCARCDLTVSFCCRFVFGQTPL